MAKELPYFRFEPDAWDHGNIQMCSREAKGLFIDLCSFYWSRLGELPYALALQKLCNGNDIALQELKQHEIIGVKDDQIMIEFLDEQLSEFLETSEKRRNAANKRWNAKAMQKQCKSNARREEKRREENKIGDYIKEEYSKVFSDWLEYKKQRKETYKSEKSLEAAYNNLVSLSGNNSEIAELIVKQSMANNWAGLFEYKGKVQTIKEQRQITLLSQNIDGTAKND